VMSLPTGTAVDIGPIEQICDLVYFAVDRSQEIMAYAKQSA